MILKFLVTLVAIAFATWNRCICESHATLISASLLDKPDLSSTKKSVLNIINAINSTSVVNSAPIFNLPQLSQKLPQAIIIGAKKCGTRALLKFIGAHYDVVTADSELHFFDRYYHMGFDWYRKQMPYSNEHQITIEKTPKYFVDKQVPQRVYMMNPNIKLIVVLRDPVIRAISEHVQSQTKKFNSFMLNSRNRPLERLLFNLNSAKTTFNRNSSINSDSLINKNEIEYNYFRNVKNKFISSKRFEQMVYEKSSLSSQKLRTNWAILRNGLYMEHLKNWLEYFPIEQILFINGEQLIREPSVEVNKLERFLNLKPIINKRHFVLNKRKGFPCIIKPLESNQVKCLSDQKGRLHPDIDANILQDLYNYYRPYNEKLFELIKEKPWWPL
jgi:hypothetical protein